MLNKSDDQKIEEAIIFLVQALQTFNRSTKPVLMHSLRIAYWLYDLGYGKDIVIAALFHDLMEDSSVEENTLVERFGRNVFDMVLACTLDKTIEDHKARYFKSFMEADRMGAACLIVRAADLIDNSYYYHLAENEKQFQILLEKFNCFLKISEQKLSREKVWPTLLERKAEIESIKWNSY